jgi:hypothetical protein
MPQPRCYPVDAAERVGGIADGESAGLPSPCRIMCVRRHGGRAVAAPKQLQLLTVGEALVRYTEHLQLRVAAGDMRQRTIETYLRDLADFVAIVNAGLSDGSGRSGLVNPGSGEQWG